MSYTVDSNIGLPPHANAGKTFPQRYIDIAGQRFGKLIAYAKEGSVHNGRRWHCKCDCGGETIAVAAQLRNGTHKSCGRRGCNARPCLTSKGYVKQSYDSHPRADTNGYVLQHILVMERKIGRYLLPHETVHHKNGQRHDNTEDNLELWSHMQPGGQRVEDKLAFAREIIRIYG